VTTAATSLLVPPAQAKQQQQGERQPLAPRRRPQYPLFSATHRLPIGGGHALLLSFAAANAQASAPRVLAASFASSSSPASADSSYPSAPRSPPRSGAGLGGPSSGGGGGLASVIAAEAGRTRVNGYTPRGFIVNQVEVSGAVLCLPETWLMWDVLKDGWEEAWMEKDEEEGEEREGGSGGRGRPPRAAASSSSAFCPDLDDLVTPESLAVLELVHPPPEVLVLGCGAKLAPRPPARLRAWLRERGASLELLRTADAVALFALLNDEGRPAVGAFLPPGMVVGGGGGGGAGGK
jgi:uncharacterized protein